MDNIALQQLIDLTERLRAQEDEVEDLKKQRAALEATLLDSFRQDGVQRVTQGGRTVWLDRKLWASAAGPELPQALKLAGFPAMVRETVNGQTLSAWVREFDPEAELSPEEVITKLPEAVQPFVKIAEVYKLQVRKG